MSDKKLISEFQEIFIGRILEKNSWEKNEIIDLWQACLLKLLLEKLQ